MRSEPEDRLSDKERKPMPSIPMILAALAVIALVAYFYFPAKQSAPPAVDAPAPVSISPVEPIPVPEVPPAPDIPTPAPAPEPLPEEAPVEPELTLADSDQDLRQTLAAVGDSPLITQALVADDLVQRSAGMIDGFSRGLVPRKVLPLKPPKEKFSTIEIDGQTYMDPAGYTRYDSYAQAIASLDLDLLVSTFHRYRPLLEQAYQALGYSAEDMDNAVIRSLDYILATPEQSTPLAIKRKEAIFQYADPELEQLTPSQKQLLRMGPENSAKIKQQAEALRKHLLAMPG